MAKSSLHKPAEQQTAEMPTGEPRPTVEQVVTDGIEGTDEPIGEHHPSAPFAIIFGAYPLALIVVLGLALAAIAWWSRT